MALCEKILIAGFSGVGKSTLLKAVESCAPEGWDHFDDLDQIILKNRGKGFTRLADLIEAKGWETFRLWERQELESWLKEEGRGVLALGGGALSPLVWELLGKNRKIKFCYLKVPFAVAWERLQKNTEEERPLLKSGKEQLEKIFQEREQVFNQIVWQLDGMMSVEELKEQFWSMVK